MADNNKRNKRLILLACIAFAITALVGIRYAQRESQRTATTAKLQADGLAAFAAGDYTGTVELLTRYAERNKPDAQTLLALGRASIRVADTEGSTYTAGLRALRDAVRMAPDDLDAAHELLDILAGIQPAEALEIADRILERNPNDLRARHMRALVLIAMNRTGDALAAANQVLEDHPLDLNMRLLSYQIRTQMGQNAHAMLAEARALTEEYADDPRSWLGLAIIHNALAQREEAVDLLNKATAMHPPDDPSYPEAVVRLHDAMGLYPRSFELLQTYAHPTKQPRLYEELVYRLFEQGMLEEAVKATEALPALATNAEYLGLRAVALRGLGRTQAYDEAINDLRERKDGGTGAAWADLLQAKGGPNGTESATVQDLAQRAVRLNRGSAYLHLIWGDATRDAGDLGPALAHYQAAAALRQAWMLPRLRMASVKLAQGDAVSAAQLAGDAIRRQPNNAEAGITLIMARGALIDDATKSEARDLLQHIASVQQAIPGESNTAVLGIRLHAMLGEAEQARTQAKALLEREQTLAYDQLLRLAAADSVYKLGLAQAINQVIQTHYGSSPELTLMEAQRLAGEGKPAEGLAIIDTAIQAQGKESDTTWAVLRTRYIEQTLPDQAVSAWQSLVSKYPADTRVLASALSAGSMSTDREFLDQTILKLQKAEGDAGRIWRTHRARYLLTDPQQKDLTENAAIARDLLKPVLAIDPTHVEAGLLMATCHERLGAIEAAMAQLTQSLNASPNDARLLLDLARLQANHGLMGDAARTAERALSLSDLSTPHRIRGATLLGQAGQTTKAIDLLLALHRSQSLTPDGYFTLAQLLERAGREPELADIVTELADSPLPEAAIFSARYHSLRGQTALAEAALARLDSLDLTEAQRVRLRGEYLASLAQPEEALASFRQSVAMNPQNSDDWRRLVGYLLEQRQASDAISEARRALTHLSNEPAMVALVEREGTVLAFGDNPGIAPLLAAIVYDDRHRAAACQAIDLMLLAQQQEQPMIRVATELYDIAKANPQFVSLQLFSGNLLLNAGQSQDAAQLASDLMARYPDMPEAAGINTQALLMSERWQDALAAATKWRQLASTQTIQPDIALATARLRLNDPKGAYAALQPHQETLVASPDTYTEGLLTLARSLIAQGQTSFAHKLISPLALTSTSWRVAYLRVGAMDIRSANEALTWLTDPVVTPPQSRTEDRMLQAQAVIALAERLNNAEAYERALALIDSIVASPNAPAVAWFLRGNLAERFSDNDTAIHAYRQAHSIAPDSTAFANNLAMSLARAKVDLDEALRLVSDLVAKNPDDANLLDTLAFVQLQSGDCEAAVASIDRAIRLDPTSLSWQNRRSQIREACSPQRAVPGGDEPQ